MCGTAGCSISPRVESAGLDPGKLAECPRTVEAPGDLPGRTPFMLDNGMWVVPLDQADARENSLTGAALLFRGMWVQCVSVVRYAEDVQAGMER